MRLNTYLINEEKFKVRSLRIGSYLWMHVNGQLWVVDLKVKRSSASGSMAISSAPSGEVYSPMPGKILKVHVKKGDVVSLQSNMVVMEAMKMEYNLLAPIAGVVESVSCSVGETVNLNQLLVVVKKGE